MPARPKPVFIMPPAVPAYLPAMSSGRLHSTALVSSRKKNDSDSRITALTASAVKVIGAMNISEPASPTNRIAPRARRRLPVRR
ncbi:hypothetical protein D3C81_1623570 [compost metagenome]